MKLLIFLGIISLVTARPSVSDPNPVAEPIFCQQDSQCVDYGHCVNHRCVCDRVCPEVVSPVCGSNGHTYSSECDMEVASCNEHKMITVAHVGSCAEPTGCTEDSECVDYAHCVNRQCVCDRMCPEVYNPVCGSDGRTYSSLCDMEVASCGAHVMITVAHQGRCGDDIVALAEPVPCSDKDDCVNYQQCVNNICECRNNGCPEPNFHSQVCGTDGHTYQSMCELEKASCRMNRLVTVAHNGHCGNDIVALAEPVPCSAKDDCINYQQCVNHFCQCVNNACPEPDFRGQVCGTDGHTYESMCELEKASCRMNQLVTVAHNGRCDHHSVAEPSPCYQNSDCSDYADCVHHRCVCDRVCPEVVNPVCGSDGQTYSSQCDMEVESCKQHKMITVSHTGSCVKPAGCTADSDCVDYGNCVNHQCVCDRMCPEVYSPVCGSDGHTYSSFCDLQVASCREHKFITSTHNGPCTQPATCSTDSQCVDYGRCEKNRCVCDNACPDNYSPVCGNDGHTYSNFCNLMETACHEHKMILTAHAGPCTVEL